MARGRALDSEQVVQVYINGESREVDDQTTIAALIQSLSLEPRHVAVEVNLEVVPRARHGQHRLATGDRLEIVTLVGGG